MDFPSELLSFWVAELRKVDLGPHQEKFNRLRAEWDDSRYGHLRRQDCEFLHLLYEDYTA